MPGTPPPEPTEAALRALAAHPWRGNIRELQNVMEHVAVVTEPGLCAITEARPSPARRAARDERRRAAPACAGPGGMEVSYHAERDRVIAEFEVRYLTWLLQRAAGNMSEAARIAGVDRTTLYRLMERHGLHREPNAGLVSERPMPVRVTPAPGHSVSFRGPQQVVVRLTPRDASMHRASRASDIRCAASTDARVEPRTGHELTHCGAMHLRDRAHAEDVWPE